MPSFLRSLARRFRPQASSDNIRVDYTVDPVSRGILERSRPHTLTGDARLLALIDAVRYCETRDIPGAFAECGVWRGGSVLAMILTLQELCISNREIWLYDTFDGMTEPGDEDVSDFDEPASATWNRARANGQRPWGRIFGSDIFSEKRVRALLFDTGYPPNLLHFVRGPVERTLPSQAPSGLALLRLDTDWYESTRHELEHLYPRLSDGGVLIVDDYGHWQGCRRAVDEYFSRSAPLLLQRVDYTCRLAIKH